MADSQQLDDVGSRLEHDLVMEKKHLESFGLLSIVVLTFPFSPCMVYLSTFG